MSPRVRAALFAAGAIACAALSAALAGAAGDPSAAYGELRVVVVTARPLDRGTALGPQVSRALERRRVPAEFVPPDALGDPAEALGRRLAVALPAGSYLTATSLAVGPARDSRAGVPPPGTSPVEISVSGAGALGAARTEPGAHVAVVVSGSAGPGPGVGHTYVAAARVPLLALREEREETGVPGDRWIATLALTRRQALRLIRAEGVARTIRLLAE